LLILPDPLQPVNGKSVPFALFGKFTGKSSAKTSICEKASTFNPTRINILLVPRIFRAGFELATKLHRFCTSA
jgi:hypothetical protein